MPNTDISTILFDFGGVLLRTEDYSPRRKWEQKLNLQPGELEAFIFGSPIGQQAQLGQASWEAVWQRAGETFGMTAEEVHAMQQDFFTGDRLDRNLVDYIRRLKQHFTIGLLSNTWYRNGRTLLLQYSIADAFDFTVTSAEMGVKKPDPRIFEIALQRANATPPQVIFVDDMEENVLAARALGLNAVYFVDAEAAIQRLVRLTDVTVS